MLTAHIPLEPLLTLHDAHHAPLTALKLVTYAADAMRVLARFEQRADHSTSFAHALTTACPDWRNPGCLEDPADLIVDVLGHAVPQLQGLFNQLQTLTSQATAAAGSAR